MKKLALPGGLVVVFALVMGACGTGGGATKTNDTAAPKASTSTTTTAPSPAPAAAPPTTPSSAPPQAPTSSTTVPIYEPSSVVSQAGGHTQLSTPDDVAKVTAFYQQALSKDGWGLTSAAKTAASANFVAKRSGLGTTIAISTAGPAGTSISVSTYPA